MPSHAVPAAEHCENNILVIPQALSQIEEAHLLQQHGQSAIYYKHLATDLLNIEFYVNTPCFLYLEGGREIITNDRNETFELGPGQAFFLPQGQNLHSDHFQSKDALRTYLLFFDNELIRDYLATQRKFSKPAKTPAHPCIFEGKALLAGFFSALNTQYRQGIQSAELLKLKLLEFLHLLDLQNPQHDLPALLSSGKAMTPRRNLVRLMQNPEMLRLTVQDLAHLSGRSVSSFNRDFKAAFDSAPQRWLKEQRLQYAHRLLSEQALSVTEVSLEVGYENISHFIKSFKERFCLTPKELQGQKLS